MFYNLFMTENGYDLSRRVNFTGGLSIAVPGELKGLYYAHSKFGRLPWSKVVTPAANIAENGFFIDSFTAQYFTRHSSIIQEFRLLSMFQMEEFPPLPGKLVKRPTLAKTLYEIANHGPDVLYNGEIGQKLINDIKANGSIITFEDLQNYHPIVQLFFRKFFVLF